MQRKTFKQTKLYGVRCRRITGGTVTESLYPPGLCQPHHAHNFASMSIVISGNYLETYGRKTFPREPSTVVFHPPYESHAVKFENIVRILNIQFDFQRLKQIREYSTMLDASTNHRCEVTASLGMRLYREFQLKDAASSLAVEGLMLELLAESSRCGIEKPEKRFPRWLCEAKDFLHANFAESFTHEDLALACGVHPVYLARVFREKFGCTIGDYLRRLRLETACREISQTRRSLAEVACAAGFSDQSHMTRTFKKNYGLTPTQYRKTLARG